MHSTVAGTEKHAAYRELERIADLVDLGRDVVIGIKQMLDIGTLDRFAHEAAELVHGTSGHRRHIDSEADALEVLR